MLYGTLSLSSGLLVAGKNVGWVTQVELDVSQSVLSDGDSAHPQCGGGASRNKWTVGIPWLGEKVGICKIVESYDHRLPALLQLNPFIKKQESLKGEMEMLSL